MNSLLVQVSFKIRSKKSFNMLFNFSISLNSFNNLHSNDGVALIRRKKQNFRSSPEVFSPYYLEPILEWIRVKCLNIRDFQSRILKMGFTQNSSRINRFKNFVFIFLRMHCISVEHHLVAVHDYDVPHHHFYLSIFFASQHAPYCINHQRKWNVQAARCYSLSNSPSRIVRSELDVAEYNSNMKSMKIRFAWLEKVNLLFNWT